MFNKKIELSDSSFMEAQRYSREKDGMKYTGYLYKNKIPLVLAQKKNTIFLEIKLFEAHKEIGESIASSDYQIQQISSNEYTTLNYFNGCDSSKFDENLLVDICEYLYKKYIEKVENVVSPV